ncbi:MBL fold metallo-hydrolase [Actinophytocola sp.]|uniref:MBL fold metallo-hydrolase n=1 Tax=Actinophytocola sp. TaxID=1872138 RepID=UPI0025BAE936|nr:MBL fold metallo-hydrolase [Actinophytocola sp.]
MSGRWVEVASGVFAGRYAELDQTLGLVVGSARCLVVDSGTDEVHGAELAAAVRERTALPWELVITHAHFDHFFGTAAFLPCPVWAHERCREVIETDGDEQRRDWAARYRDKGEPELAHRLEAAALVVPDRVFTDRVELDLGERMVELVHPGLGHTDHDVIVHVPDAGVVFAGDLVEQGAPPHAGPDAVPGQWPSTLDAVLRLGARVIVPGHGEPVDAAFVRAQRDELAR